MLPAPALRHCAVCDDTGACFFCFGTGIVFGLVALSAPCPACTAHPGCCFLCRAPVAQRPVTP